MYRAVATPNAFVHAGWRVTVVTAERESFAKYTGEDPSMEPLVDPRIRVVRVPFRREYLEDDVATWSRWRMEMPYVWLGWQILREQLAFPEKKYGFWRPELERAVRRVHREEPADLVLGTANPHVDLAGAAALRRYGVPYILDHRDAWQLDTFAGTRAIRPGSRADRWESRLVNEASEVWFVNDPIRRWHADIHPEAAERMYVVPNGADGELTPAGGPRRQGGKIRFAYLGTITSKVPVQELAEGWRIAQQGGWLADAHAVLYGYVGFFNQTESDELKVLDRVLAETDIRYGGPVPKARVAEIYSQVDALMLVMGGGKYITSGKTYEYLSTGLPIVSVHDPASAASEELRDYPLWFPARSLDPADIAEALAAAAREVRNPNPTRWRAAAEVAPQYRREAVLAPHIERLTKMVAK